MTTSQASEGTQDATSQSFWGQRSAYDRWLDSLDLPVHKGYFVDDLRTIDLGDWGERECRAAFLQLAGQEGVTESRVTEVPPGATLPRLRFALDESVYVVEGRGLTTVWQGESAAPRTFEWQKHSIFMLPRNSTHQITNTSGTDRALLLHYNYLPLAMGLAPEPEFYFNSPFQPPARLERGPDLYEPARASQVSGARGTRNVWFGNFFPDMQAWDQLDPFKGRGAGGHAVWIQFPDSPLWSHMSVFPAKTYKKAHRHGPGVVIVIPGGEGFSIMWAEGQEKVVIPWHEASVFVPPDRWFHQHFNVGETPGRYLAMHSPRFLNRASERIEDLARDQIEYPEEDAVVRQTFEAELAKRGLTTLMPEQAYQDPKFEWDYDEGSES